MATKANVDNAIKNFYHNNGSIQYIERDDVDAVENYLLSKYANIGCVREGEGNTERLVISNVTAKRVKELMTIPIR